MKSHIRWMIRRDLPTVLAIEADCFERPWTEEEFLGWLRQRPVIALVAELHERVVAFVVYELCPTHINIINFAVHPCVWRRGIGRAIVDKLRGKLNYDRRTRLKVKVRETNLDAQLFFRAMGFVATDILHDSFDDSNEDALLMEYRIRQEASV